LFERKTATAPAIGVEKRMNMKSIEESDFKDVAHILERDFKSVAPCIGITEKVGDVVVADGIEFRIVGWWSRGAGKFPIAAVRVSDGMACGLTPEAMPSHRAAMTAFRAARAARDAAAAAGK
jgi:hypothetical protein